MMKQMLLKSHTPDRPKWILHAVAIKENSAVMDSECFTHKLEHALFSLFTINEKIAAVLASTFHNLCLLSNHCTAKHHYIKAQGTIVTEVDTSKV